uniref:SET domain-containing protein n=1 Tax=Trypanosoma congolense (strain IL3000) TaxID=1068625 RepID=G0UX07_TRYCI|nr:conserved hypothetical protein [Trypanosoma congolense IL3000]
MICEVLERIVTEILERACMPMSAKRLAGVMCDVVTVDNMTAMCLRMLDNGVLERWGDDAFALRCKNKVVLRNLLITSEYQTLGMTMLPIGEGKFLKYIPRDSEHRFFEVRQSVLGTGAGLGLFMRPTRALRQGTVMCEYVGRILRRLPRSRELGTYVVRLRTASFFVDGVNERGEHLSLATFINDSGPNAANAVMREYDTLPGRVFVVATRDIRPGEEIFCTYGSTYWGYSTYDELQHSIRTEQRKRQRDEARDDFCCDLFFRCRRCGEEVTKRLLSLHNITCGDELVKKKMTHLNCLPFNEFTSMENINKVLPSNRYRTLKRAKHFVNLTDPQTFGLSHEDVVGDLTFTWSTP